MERKLKTEGMQEHEVLVGVSGKHGTAEIDRFYPKKIIGFNVAWKDCIEDEGGYHTYISIFINTVERNVYIYTQYFSDWQGSRDKCKLETVSLDDVLEYKLTDEWLNYYILKCMEEAGLFLE